MKIALVHDYLNQYGGAERVLLALSELWPEAPIFTSLIDRERLQAQGFPLSGKNIITSFMDKLPFKKLWAQSYFLPFYPLAFERFTFDEFDVVLSVTSFAAKGIITKPRTLHLSYICTPTRHLWNFEEYVSHHATVKGFHRPLLSPLISYLRMWDRVASTRPDKIIAISHEVQKRIQHVYRRDSDVVYPPVDIQRLKNGNQKNIHPSDYFLIVSRLSGHKRVDLAIDAFNRLGWPLKIIGEGPKLSEYRALAKANIEFLGRLSDEGTTHYFQRCRALIFPQIEDFGITLLEAQAAGRPVIAYRGGGALETVIEGRTGEFFYPQTAAALEEVLHKFQESNYNPIDCQQQAGRFSLERFKQEIRERVEAEWKAYRTA